MTRGRRRVALLGVFAATVAAAASALLALDRYLDPYTGAAFDPAVWAAARGNDRLPMGRAAAERLWSGMPEAEVVALFGPPDEERVLPGGSARLLSYRLGGSWRCHLRSVDSGVLSVRLDAGGQVVGWHLSGD